MWDNIKYLYNIHNLLEDKAYVPSVFCTLFLKEPERRQDGITPSSLSVCCFGGIIGALKNKIVNIVDQKYILLNIDTNITWLGTLLASIGDEVLREDISSLFALFFFSAKLN